MRVLALDAVFGMFGFDEALKKNCLN